MHLIRTAALAVALAFPASAHAGANLDRLASSAAAQPITVACSVPTDAPEAGWTVVGSSTVALNSTACRALGHLALGDARWLRSATDHVDNTALAGAAVQVLVHEAMHLRLASGDEALVECTASRNYWPLIASLHLPARLAQRVLSAATYTHRNLRNPTYKEDC